MKSDFITVGEELVDEGVIEVFRRHEESGGDGAPAGLVLSLQVFQEFAVEAHVPVIHGVVKGEHHKLWHLFDGDSRRWESAAAGAIWGLAVVDVTGSVPVSSMISSDDIPV